MTSGQGRRERGTGETKSKQTNGSNVQRGCNWHKPQRNGEIKTVQTLLFHGARIHRMTMSAILFRKKFFNTSQQRDDAQPTINLRQIYLPDKFVASRDFDSTYECLPATYTAISPLGIA